MLEALHLINGCNFDAVADSLGELVEHYALAVCAMPPAEAYDELIAVRSYVDDILRSNKTAQWHKWRPSILLSNGTAG
ncbi:hypothetical protein [Actinoallomurus sp. NPDC050550]|uniref:hypothetical protein n=1 Tax=Actinoallomurus sp. NPDC050550 TaxID=3154937 RepID=UPI0033ED0A23